jgi:hypothetical protein
LESTGFEHQNKGTLNEGNLILIQGIFFVTRRVNGSVLHRYRCIASREAHAIFADDSACLTANNVWNEGK